MKNKLQRYVLTADGRIIDKYKNTFNLNNAGDKLESLSVYGWKGFEKDKKIKPSFHWFCQIIATSKTKRDLYPLAKAIEQNKEVMFDIYGEGNK